MKKDSEIKDRMRRVRDEMGGTVLSRKSGLTVQRISTAITAKNQGISGAIIKGLWKAGISLNWLMNGEGGMFLENQREKPIKIDQQTKELAEKEEYIRTLKQLIESKQTEIDYLKKEK